MDFINSVVAQRITTVKAIFDNPAGFDNAVAYELGLLSARVDYWKSLYKGLFDQDLVDKFQTAMAAQGCGNITPEMCSQLGGDVFSRIISTATTDIKIFLSEVDAINKGNYGVNTDKAKQGIIDTAKQRMSIAIVSEAKERAINDDPVADTQEAIAAKIQGRKDALKELGLDDQEIKAAQWSGKTVTFNFGDGDKGFNPYVAYGLDTGDIWYS